jgi:pleckstrin homology domain-containing family A member 1/2
VALITQAIGIHNIVKYDAREPPEDSLVRLHPSRSLTSQGVEDDSEVVLKASAPIVNPQDVLSQTISLCWQFPKLEGYLLKKGEKGPRKDWKKRWFSLRGCRLYYFKTEEIANSSGGQPINFIDLRDVVYSCIIRESSVSGVPKVAEHNLFQVDIGRRTYYLLAKSMADRDRWLRGIEACCKVLSKSQPDDNNNSSSSASPSTASTGIKKNTTMEGDEEEGDDANPSAFVDAVASSSTQLAPSGGPASPTSGYLHKMGEDMLKNWKNRFFVLKDRHLYYYKTENDERPINMIPLSKMDRVDPTENTKKEHAGCAFHIVCPGRTYYLIAQSHEDRQRWIEAIRFQLRKTAFKN